MVGPSLSFFGLSTAIIKFLSRFNATLSFLCCSELRFLLFHSHPKPRSLMRPARQKRALATVAASGQEPMVADRQQRRCPHRGRVRIGGSNRRASARKLT